MKHLSEKELMTQLKLASRLVEVGAIYAHYRNPKSRYQVIDLSIIEATQEVGVIYRKEFGSKALSSIIWVRPLSSWCEKICVEDAMVPRFQKVVELQNF